MNNNFMQMLSQIKSNPQQFFGNMQGVDMNNPYAIIEYKMNNRQISQSQYNKVMEFVRQNGYKG